MAERITDPIQKQFDAARSDCYILQSVIHDWNDERASHILKNCRTAMPPKACLLLIEHLVTFNPESSEAKLFDINMLVMLGGSERTGLQYEALLQAAGLRIITIVPTFSPFSIVEAVPYDI